MSYHCIGLGLAHRCSQGNLLDVYYPFPLFQPNEKQRELFFSGIDIPPAGEHELSLSVADLEPLAQAFKRIGSEENAKLCEMMQDNSSQSAILCLLEHDLAPTSIAEAYLKLHLLSLRHCRPHEQDLSGLFGLLPNNAWTSEGPISLQDLPERQRMARLRGKPLSVDSIDKFPKMSDYVVPDGVRVADARRVRLGAYLGAGTTVMHEGFVNFNAGTEGPNMVEGRISAGVFVGKGSDLGGGCSTMGTLAGGNDVVISIGAECLIGANAGVGIPLGDRCTIEAGLYLTGGSIVTLLSDTGEARRKCKAHELAGQSDLLFIRHSVSGEVQCRTNRTAIALNEDLHANN